MSLEKWLGLGIVAGFPYVEKIHRGERAEGLRQAGTWHPLLWGLHLETCLLEQQDTKKLIRD